METSKPVVFVITPFNEECLALFNELKKQFTDSFSFTNAADMDNQQNVLKDIVEGIATADIVIADLTGLNANVFYELGLAHAMNKKVIIITQDIDILPFDIKSYRAIPYSLQFNKFPLLIEELQKLLNGAIDGSIQYGNPVSDYAPSFYTTPANSCAPKISQDDIAPIDTEDIENDDQGYWDHITEIQKNSQTLNNEILAIGSEMEQMGESVTDTTNKINKVKIKSGNPDPVFVRNVYRKLSEPIALYADKLKGHTNNISTCWNKIENDYLELLDNRFIKQPENIQGLENSIPSLIEMQTTIEESNEHIDEFIFFLQESTGIERKLTKAVNNLIIELQNYLITTDTMISSIDRIISKSNIVIQEIELQN